MSKQGNPWAAVTIEDMEGSVEIMFFGETYLAYSTVAGRGRGRRDPRTRAARDETMQLQAMEVSLPDVSQGPTRRSW